MGKLVFICCLLAGLTALRRWNAKCSLVHTKAWIKCRERDLFDFCSFPSTLRIFCCAKRRIFFAEAKKLVASVPTWSEQKG